MTNGTMQTPGALPSAAAWFQQPGMGYFPGQTVAGFNPMQQNAWGAGLAGAGQVAGMVDQFGRGFMNYLSQPGQFTPSMDWFNNPHMQAAVQGAINPMIQSFERQTMPGISTAFSSQPGSTRQGIAQGLALSDLNQQIGDTSSRMYANMYQQGQQSYLNDMRNQLQARQAAWQQAPGMMSAWSQGIMSPYEMMSGIGGQQQQLAQARLSGEMDRWNYYRDLPQQRLNQYMGWLGGAGNMNMPQVSAPTANPWGVIPGFANTIANLPWGDIMGAGQISAGSNFNNAWNAGINQPLGYQGGY